MRVKENPRRVLRELAANARSSDNDVARKVGLSQVTVSKIRNQLECEGIIRGYTCLVDLHGLGYRFGSLIFILWNADYWRDHVANEERMFGCIERIKDNLVFMSSLNSTKYDGLFIAVFKDFEEKRRVLNIIKTELGDVIENMMDLDIPIPNGTDSEAAGSAVSYLDIVEKIR
jgi:DNA-binding Lrp family transcriptional regulator